MAYKINSPRSVVYTHTHTHTYYIIIRSLKRRATTAVMENLFIAVALLVGTYIIVYTYVYARILLDSARAISCCSDGGGGGEPPGTQYYDIAIVVGQSAFDRGRFSSSFPPVRPALRRGSKQLFRRSRAPAQYNIYIIQTVPRGKKKNFQKLSSKKVLTTLQISCYHRFAVENQRSHDRVRLEEIR